MRILNLNVRRLLHSLAAIIEKHSPLKGELVDVEITNINGHVSYTYKKVA